MDTKYYIYTAYYKYIIYIIYHIVYHIYNIVYINILYSKTIYILNTTYYILYTISSSYWPVSMYQRRAHIKAVVFHTMHRGLRDTRLCPYLITCANLDPSVVPPHYYSPRDLTSSSVSFQVTSLYPFLIPSSKMPWSSPTPLFHALLIYPSF